MPFVANTPESLLGRRDSKNPHSTCHGLTSGGVPCRRSISRAALPSPRRPSATLGQPSVAHESLYCWQHKAQAAHSARSSPGPRGRAPYLVPPRSSLDTLAERLGLLELIAEEKSPRKKRAKKPKPRQKQRQQIPAPGSPTNPTTSPDSEEETTFCCCFAIAKNPPPSANTATSGPGPRPRPHPAPIREAASGSVSRHGKDRKPKDGMSLAPQPTPNGAISPSKKSCQSSSSAASQTALFKALIPDDLDAGTASALMVELSRPYADAEEPGYIYIFQLTPHGHPARPLVDPFAVTGATGRSSRRTMLLKIGRAANVQRRINEWQRQCGHDIEVLRWYPYLSVTNSSKSTAPQPPRPTPHCRRVERLVHLELSGMSLRACVATCKVCGRHHREWFEVEATREAIRRVDNVIRKWIKWDEASYID